MPDFWYQERHKKTHPSASKILGFLKTIHNFESVVDLGCGVGTWLYSAKEIGAKKIQGFDASKIDPAHLMISSSEFQRFDLNIPFEATTKFDLGISLEVAEHINATSADTYLELLCTLSPFILFSAAIPGQGGTGHVNEQEPLYWIKKFSNQGFEVFDVIRPKIWNDTEILPWYKQNCFLFVKKDLVPTIKNEVENLEDWKGKYIVHPYFFEMKNEQLMSPIKLTKAFAKLLINKH
jgi:SAM-dependent methyltransferase